MSELTLYGKLDEQRPSRVIEGDARSMTIEGHVRRAVWRAKLSARPFPFIYVTGLLPDDFYSALHASWPDFAEMKHPAPTVGRLDFNGDGFDKMG